MRRDQSALARDVSDGSLVVLIAISVSACASWLSGFPGGSEGPFTILRNDGPQPYVVAVAERDRTRYYAASRGAEIVIDSVGELNPGPETITLLDFRCAAVWEIPWRNLGWKLWDDGGTIRITGDAQASFVPGKRGYVHEDIGAHDSCEDASAELSGV